MMWLTWRQSRAQIIVTSTVLAVFAIALAITGPNLAHQYDISGIATCNPDGSCATLVTKFLDSMPNIDMLLYFLGIGLLYAVPAIIGIFWGAPLVAREIEAHTHRLAWNQSVTRTRWLAVKLGLLGAAATASSGLLSLMLTWWSAPADSALSRNPGHGISLIRVGPALFGARGITPIGYAVFAFALGVTAGVLIRRTLPAMAATLAGFAIIQIAMPTWMRARLITPARALVALNPENIDGANVTNNNSMTVLATPSYSPQGAWILSSQITDKAGHLFNGTPTRACETSNFQACLTSIVRLHLRQLVTYQPASRFWALQWHEIAIFLVLALLLAGVCYWWIRRPRVA
jgi:ABC-type transport system involved in multi-copper enzyme maturation permease subunit